MTAGTSGAFTSLQVGVSTEINLNAYADGSPAGSTTGVGFNLAVNETPQFEEIYIYDVKGEALADADTFTINAITYTIESSGVTPGPFGFVQSYDTTNAHLKITLGEGSSKFTAGTVFYDTPTLNNGSRTFAELLLVKYYQLTTLVQQMAADKQAHITSQQRQALLVVAQEHIYYSDRWVRCSNHNCY